MEGHTDVSVRRETQKHKAVVCRLSEAQWHKFNEQMEHEEDEFMPEIHTRKQSRILLCKLRELLSCFGSEYVPFSDV